MPDATKYQMDVRPEIPLPEVDRVREIIASIQDEEAREELLGSLDGEYCDEELLESNLPPDDAKYVRQYVEGVEVAGFTLGVEGGMIDFSFSITLRQRGPEFVVLCADDSDPYYQPVATLKSVATFREMLDVVRAAFAQIFPDAPWPQAVFSGDLEVPFDPRHYCRATSTFYPELSLWFKDFVEEYTADFRGSSEKIDCRPELEDM